VKAHIDKGESTDMQSVRKRLLPNTGEHWGPEKVGTKIKLSSKHGGYGGFSGTRGKVNPKKTKRGADNGHRERIEENAICLEAKSLWVAEIRLRATSIETGTLWEKLKNERTEVGNKKRP